MRKLSYALLVLLISGLLIGGPVARGLARQHRKGRQSEKEYREMDHDEDSSGWRGYHGRGFFHRAEDLELDQSQKSELREKRREWRLKAIDKRAQIKKKRLELQGLLAEEDVNMSHVRQRVNKLHDLRADFHFARLEHRQAMKEVLTAEQRKKLPGGLLGPGRRGRYHSGGMMGPGRMHRMMGPGRGRMMGPGRRRMMGPGRHDERGPGRMHRDDDEGMHGDDDEGMHRGPGRGRGRYDEDESRDD